jgi:hypothetical protein
MKRPDQGRDQDPDLQSLRELLEPLSGQRVASEEAEAWVKAALAQPVSKTEKQAPPLRRVLLTAAAAASIGFGLGAWWFGQMRSSHVEVEPYASAAPDSGGASRTTEDRSVEFVRVVLK